MLRYFALAALALAACSPPSSDSTFALVAYADAGQGELESYVLDTGLTVSDCAQALHVGAAYAATAPESMRLLTCEPESK